MVHVNLVVTGILGGGSSNPNYTWNPALMTLVLIGIGPQFLLWAKAEAEDSGTGSR